MVAENQDFGQFTTTLLRAGIIDNNYPVKGCFVWLPDGFKFKQIVFSMIEEAIKEGSYQRFQFPRLIPGKSIKKVTENIYNFEEGLFWLRTKEGKEIDLFLNPTGECGVYTMFKRWIRDEIQLPKRAYQIGTTFRPHRRPDALLNGDELSSLLEAHSAFASKEDADREFFNISLILNKVHDKMGIPYLALNRPIEGNKPVCIDMISYETYLPSKNTSFNVGVHYNQGQIYSKAFDIKFRTKKNIKEHTHQVTFGISERGLAAMLDLHRDDLGLRILPEFAPTQTLTLPVYGGDVTESEITVYAEKLHETFLKDYRSELDNSNRKAGKKLAEGRLRGIPIRIGASGQDVKNGTARVYLRSREDPICNMNIGYIKKELPYFMESIRNDIVSDANRFFKTKIHSADSIFNTQEIVNGDHIARIYYCGRAECFEFLGRNISGELLGTDLSETIGDRCLVCGKVADSPSYYAKRSSSP